jgi:RimJ/RimL family protein N-acetyltransferase
MENKIEIKHITLKDVLDLEFFIDNAGNSLNSFRYFNSRDITCINNHIITTLVYKNNTPIAYGHLDKDGEKVWLGVCVSEKHKKKGFGNLIMKELITYANKLKIEKINLSVNVNNSSAIKLYEKIGFSIINELKENVYLMVLKLNHL